MLGEGDWKLYVDDSMKMVERPVYDPNNKQYKHKNPTELLGLYTYPSVHGCMLEETKAGKQSYFGFTNSHTTGVTYSSKNTLDIGLHRNIHNMDLKGIP